MDNPRAKRLPERAAIAFLALICWAAAGSSLSSAAEAAPPKARLGTLCGGVGTAGGQCRTARGLAVNHTGSGGVATGSAYVVDANNRRIQQFTEDGAFVRAFALGVNQTTGGNVCTAVSGDVCKEGTSSAVAGALNQPYGIAVDQATGAVFVSEQNNRRVSVFSATGTFEGAFGWDVVNGGAAGTGNVNSNTTISGVVTTQKTFSVGQKITGEGIPANTTITAVGAGSITLSQAATETKSGVALTVAEGPGNIAGNEQQTVTLGGGPTGGTFSLTFTTPNPSNTTATATGIPYDASAAQVQSALEGLSNIGAGNVAVTGSAGGPWTVEFTGIRFADTNVSQMTGNSSALTPAGTIAFATVREAGAPEFCTTVCQVGTAGSRAGQFFNLESSAVAMDPRDGDIYVSDFGNARISEYEIAVNGFGQVTGATFARALGWKVNVAAPEEKMQQCTILSGCQKGTTGGSPGQFAAENPGPITVDSDGYIYAVNIKYTGACSASAPCSIIKIDPEVPSGELFGPTAGECQMSYTSGTSNAQASVDIAVDPVEGHHDNHVYVLKKTAAAAYRVFELDESGGECVVSPPPTASALTSATTMLNHGLAVGVGGRVYSDLTAANGAGVQILGEAPAPGVDFGEVSEITGSSAKLTGTVTPPAELEGAKFPTTWQFQYSTDQDQWTSTPVPAGIAGEVPSVPVPVETVLTALEPNTVYFVRLCATTGPTACDPKLPQMEKFTTASIKPTVIPFSADVTQTEATLGAEINPNKLATSYHFEWASQAEWDASPGSYGHRIPAKDRQIGSGTDIVYVGEQLSGLSPATRYHFRVKADNSASGGETVSPDQQLETLNSCGLTDTRCFELVSRADKGSVASPGKLAATNEAPQLQAAPAGSAIAYVVESGYSDATASFEQVYLARRGDSDWGSTQVDPPTLRPPTGLSETRNGRTNTLATDLGCAVVESTEPLTANTPATVIEAGGRNLFRRDNSAGSYEAITFLPPTGANFASTYSVIGSSSDCRRVLFVTNNRYPGIPTDGGSNVGQLYEWDEGVLRNVAIIPGTGGENDPEPAEALPGSMDENPSEAIGGKNRTNYWRAVSRDGKRSIFTAVSREGNDIGKRAIFLRDTDDPGVLAGTKAAIDVSQSETATDNTGNSRYWTASTDGKRILFTARYGLADNSSSFAGVTACANVPTVNGGSGSGEGCALYEYDLAKPVTERLTELSTGSGDAKGPGVVGVLDASEKGDYVYFAARGRLGDAGKTEVENLASSTYNVYLAHGGGKTFVGTIRQAEASSGRVLISTATGSSWTSQASADGVRFAYESSLGVPGGTPMVHLFSAVSGNTVCVSCRHDGEDSFPAASLTALTTPLMSGQARNTRPIIITDNGRLFFYSVDPLATGGVEGRRNLYQWEHGQVSLIATEPEGLPIPPGDSVPVSNFFGGASADGNDVFLTSPFRLASADQDERWDVYDARVGGGFPDPIPPVRCDPTLEGACNGGAAHGSTSVAGSALTQTFIGPGNQKAKQKPKKHKKTRKHKKKSSQKKKGKKAGKSGRANGERRAGK